MNRRKFLRHAGHSLAIPGLVSSFGFSMARGKSLQSFLQLASGTDRVLVMIYLQGGNDGLNTVVPLDQMSVLNKVRPHVVLPDKELLELEGTSVGLHPALKDFKSLFDEKRLGIIQNTGYPEQNYSHFRSTDIWMSGSDADQLVNSGWPGRVLAQEFPQYPEEYPNVDMPDPLSVEIGYGSSLLFQGPTASMSVVLNNADSFYDLVDNVEEEAPDTIAGDKLKFVRLIARQSQLYGQVVKEAAQKVKNHSSYPEDNELAAQLKIVSKLIAGGLKTPVYMVRIGGFDTHDAQVLANDHTSGEHAELLKKVNDAVMAFVRDLEFQGTDDRVLGMTFSEFGRRIVSNASLGTDHGSAAPMFVFGNEVTGGIVGDNPIISPNSTYEHNLDMQFDFRQVNASILEQWFGVDNSDASSALLGNFDTLPIIGKPDPVISGINPYKDTTLKVYPNPITGPGHIEFNSDGAPVEISLIDLQGRKLQTIHSGTLPKGTHNLGWNAAGLNRGRYFLVYKTAHRQFAQQVIKH